MARPIAKPGVCVEPAVLGRFVNGQGQCGRQQRPVSRLAAQIPSEVSALAITIRPDDLSDERTQALVRAHFADLSSLTPAESCHVLDLDQLRKPGIHFWSAWDGEQVVGIGALADLGGGRGELKSMRVADSHRGTGVGRAILRVLIDSAVDSGFISLWLETGTEPEFKPARRLYASEGFVTCAPFGTYKEDPLSTYMTRQLG